MDIKFNCLINHEGGVCQCRLPSIQSQRAADNEDAQMETLNTLYRTQLDIVQEQGMDIHRLNNLLEMSELTRKADQAEISRLKGELEKEQKLVGELIREREVLSDYEDRVNRQRDLWRSVAMGAKEALEEFFCGVVEYCGKCGVDHIEEARKALAAYPPPDESRVDRPEGE